MDNVNIFWFRRDLRFSDNHGFFKALENGKLIAIYIFDSTVITNSELINDNRIKFIYSEIVKIKSKLEESGSTLLLYYDKPVNAFKKLLQKYNIQSVYYNNEYEPYTIQRDIKVSEFLISCGIKVKSFKDSVIFDKNEVVKKDGNPYTIFTPYSRKWKEKLSQTATPHFITDKLLHNLYKTNFSKETSLEKIGLKPLNFSTPKKLIDQTLISNYTNTRDFPFLEGTSRLSIHLRYGTISIRELVKVASELNETFLNELIWREFYIMILWNFPEVINRAFKFKYEYINWRNNEEEFKLWCNGKTGYPIVDAGMRELNKTGFMHNRARMITASFLTKHLLIDWRWGETYFAQQLLDYELASNNGGWQWAASTGCDAVPYFRIFNPELQTKRFDPDFKYVKRWVPEYGSKNYPKPIVEHQFARDRAIKTYKNIL